MTVRFRSWNSACAVDPKFRRGPVGEARAVESHHGLDLDGNDLVTLHGRVVDIMTQRPDGSTEQVERLPSGGALRGFDEHDDGHLEQAWTGEALTPCSDWYLVTIAH